MQDLNSNSNGKSKAETLRRAVYSEKVWIKTSELWQKLYKIQSKFSLHINQYLILQKIVMSGESKDGMTCITDARFESKQAVADSFGVSFEAIRHAEKALRKKELIVSSGSRGSKARQIAIGQDVIDYLVGHSKRVSRTPLKGYPVPLKEASKGVSRTPHSIETRSIESSRATTTNSLCQFYQDINKVTGPADSREKNEPFRQALERHGPEGFQVVLDQLKEAGVKFVWHTPSEDNELPHTGILDVFSGVLCNAKPG